MLNDALAAEAKRAAGEQNATLSELVNEALRERLNKLANGTDAVAFHMPVFGDPSDRVDTPASVFSRSGEDEELRDFG